MRELTNEMWQDALDILNSIAADQIEDITWKQDPKEETAAYREVVIKLRSPIFIRWAAKS